MNLKQKLEEELNSLDLNSKEDFEKAQKVNSNTQLYKQAGNAIVVDVLEHIFYNLFMVKGSIKGVSEK